MSHKMALAALQELGGSDGPGATTLAVLAGERACSEVLGTQPGLCLSTHSTQDSKVISLCMQGPAVLCLS